MTPQEAKKRARELRVEGKSLAEIAEAIGNEGFRTQRGGFPTFGTVAHWVPRTYRRKRKSQQAEKPASGKASHAKEAVGQNSGSVQKLRLIETILKSSYMKADDRIAAALLMIGK